MDIHRKLEAAANVAIVVLCVAIVGVAVWRYVVPHESERANTRLPLGKQLTLPDTNWASAATNVVFVMSTKCHFCTESAPLYRQATELAHQRGGRAIAVFPQSSEEAGAYLAGLNLQVDSVRSIPLNKIGVLGTPTVLIVSRTGIVIDGWSGAVPPSAQASVLKKLAPNNNS